jgi:hypothetical protein
MLPAAWPSQGTATQRRPVEPLLPPRTRSSDPQPFPGLTRTPPCAACEPAHAHGPQPPGCSPPRIVPTRGRPRQVDTSFHFCPKANCDYWGWIGLGNSSANGHPNSGPWRQLHCSRCGGYFQETHGTPLHGKRVAPEKLVWAVGALAEDFLPFVNPNLSNFLPHLPYRFTTNPACIIARTMTQHSHQDTQ